MTTAGLVALLVERTGESDRRIRYVLSGFQGVVKAQFMKGGSLRLRGFGMFYLKRRAARRIERLFSGGGGKAPGVLKGRYAAGFRGSRELWRRG